MQEKIEIRCQFPIIKGPKKCGRLATHYDRWGWAFCDGHKQKDHTPLRKIGMGE